jgi:phage protein D
MPALSYTLLIDNQPADPDLLAAIQQIEVEDHAQMADMLRLSLAIGVNDSCSQWNVVDEDIFQYLTEIRLLVTVGNRTEPLIAARVIETNANFSNQPGQSVYHVVAMDPTVLLNLQQKVKPWPNLSDSTIATAIFTDPDYREYNFIPIVEATRWQRQETDQLVIQRGTDMQFLRQLAERNGYECYMELNPLTQQVEAHFHPPRLNQPPQGVLSVNLGEATNVNRFNPRYEMLRPTTADASGLDADTQQEQPAETDRSQLTELGRETTLHRERPRRTLLSRTGQSRTGELQTLVQAVVDRSAWAITAEGELNTVAYGGILRAKRPVEVRGAGRQFSGVYYVEQVTHTFTGDGYTQQFSLSRNASGLTGRERFVAIPTGL